MIRACYESSSSGLSLKGIARVIDCPVSGVEVRSVLEVKEFAESALRSVFRGLLGGRVIFDSNEAIGYTHTLHRFRVPVELDKYIGVRVVVHYKKIMRVLFTIPFSVDVKPACRISVYSPELELAEITTRRDTSGETPRGQVYIDIPVVYAILGIPEVDLSKWALRLEGLIEKSVVLTLPDLYELGVEEVKVNFHCVTGWSVRELDFTGVSTRKLVELVKPLDAVKWIYVESLDGYSTIIPYEEFTREGSLVAIEMNKKPLDILHGYPARLIIPHLYGWKSAKWITRIVFTNEYKDGYWEALGYHPRGRVDLEERFKYV